MATTDDLPQLGGDLYLSDGGLETALIYLQGVDLPHFAAFPLIETKEGRAHLRAYFEPFLKAAVARKLGFVLDTPTWRANPDWGAVLGYSAEALVDLNKRAVTWARALAEEFATPDTPVVVSGVVGPRGDGYVPDKLMTAAQARRYHFAQVEALASAGADMVSAITMNYPAEGVGIALAARDAGVPAVISFTLETDGRLATGDSLEAAIAAVEQASDAYPAYYMINCAHPAHFAETLPEGAGWTGRIRGIRANASTRSHAELDAATDLDAGDPDDWPNAMRSCAKSSAV